LITPPQIALTRSANDSSHRYSAKLHTKTQYQKLPQSARSQTAIFHAIVIQLLDYDTLNHDSFNRDSITA
ncbi:MAG: hypothetical protein E6493_05105, partial [Alloscardovia omnicolens]|nr:hypothetical protein [Alloscardovia omnicolens]